MVYILVISIENLNKANWYKESLMLDSNWNFENGYYPILNRCNYNPTEKTCTETNEKISKQEKIKVQ